MFKIIIIIGIVSITVLYFVVRVFNLIPSSVSRLSVPPGAKDVHYGYDYPGNEALGNSFHIRYDYNTFNNKLPITAQMQFDNILEQIKFYEVEAKKKGGELYGTDSFTPDGNKISCEKAEYNYISLNSTNPNADTKNTTYQTRCFIQISGLFPSLSTIDFRAILPTDIWQIY